MAHHGRHAIVIGASMGGLLAGRALADYYDEVTLLDRDALPLGYEPRKGVPQGRHSHGLLARGREVLDQLFPGFSAEMVAEGAVPGDVADAVLWFNHGFYLRNVHSGLSGLAISRPMLEGGVRRRLLQLPNVRIRECCNVLGPIYDRDRNRVIGVQVKRETVRTKSKRSVLTWLSMPAAVVRVVLHGWRLWDTPSRVRSRLRSISATKLDFTGVGRKTCMANRERLLRRVGLIGVLASFWRKRVNGGLSPLQATSTMKFRQMKSGLLNSREVCLSRRYSTLSKMQNHWVQSWPISSAQISAATIKSCPAFPKAL
jgi:hypothetical protein